jgi:ferritin-like metal-binding protein YciE
MAKTSKDIIYLEQLFSREAHELYQDEALLGEAFGLFRDAANNPVLSELLEQGRRDTLDIAAALKEHLSGALGKGRRPALRGIFEEGQSRATSLGNNHLVDAQLISTMQRLLGYQLAGYETVANFARMLRQDALEGVIARARQSKEKMARQLSEVAVHQVHWRANWWAPEHSTAWDRVKAAFRRDWEQTKAHVGAAPPLPDGPQKAGDTVAQMTGKQEVVPGTFEAHEPAFRYGYGAAHHYRDRDWSPELEDELRANYGGIWENARDHIRAGWDYARPEPVKETHRVIILDDDGNRIA